MPRAPARGEVKETVGHEKAAHNLRGFHRPGRTRTCNPRTTQGPEREESSDFAETIAGITADSEPRTPAQRLPITLWLPTSSGSIL
jgi:hypothetical protein